MKATSKLFPPIILLGLSIVINTLPAHALSCPSGGERLSVSGRGSSYFASYHGDNEGGKMESSKLIAVGDNNGDGIDDMAFLIDEGMGTIHIIYGSLGNMDTMMKPMYRYSSQDKGYTIVGTPDCIISSFGFVGDFNGDGIGGDAAIGCKGLRKVIVIYGIQTYERDRVYLDTTSLSSNLAFQVDATGDSELKAKKFGYTISGGDLNGDGISDLIIGSPWETDVSGGIYVVYGSTSTRNNIFGVDSIQQGFNGYRIDGPSGAMASNFGSVLAYLGDVDGDGIGDLAASIFNEVTGKVFVVSGMTGIWSSGPMELSSNPETPPSNFNYFVIDPSSSPSVLDGGILLGESLSYAGDFDGDGMNDILIGYVENSNTLTGGFYIIYGNNNYSSSSMMILSLNDLDELKGFRFTPPPDNYMGLELFGGKDFNGDGMTDVMTGTPRNRDYARGGEIHVLYGFSERDTAIINSVEEVKIGRNGGFVIVGDDENMIGQSLCSGDFNGDGVIEIFSTSSWNPISSGKKVHIYPSCLI